MAEVFRLSEPELALLAALVRAKVRFPLNQTNLCFQRPAQTAKIRRGPIVRQECKAL